MALSNMLNDEAVLKKQSCQVSIRKSCLPCIDYSFGHFREHVSWINHVWGCADKNVSVSFGWETSGDVSNICFYTSAEHQRFLDSGRHLVPGENILIYIGPSPLMHSCTNNTVSDLHTCTFEQQIYIAHLN